ncbi:MAG: hypothetical protein J6S96_06420 [Muribaculaceae bacterium]|nr:hypothetical protein [Muribaculaceae bacterium]
MKRDFSIFILACWFIAALSQPNSSNIGKQPVLPSWQTYEFMKYGSIGASLYTGTINYSIPIYTYKDADFDYTLSIDYATNGLRVNHKSGILGHSWNLKSPGIITREINGLPDEISKDITATGGYTAVLRAYKNITPDNYIFSYLCNKNNQIFTCLDDNHSNHYDAEPDIYTFNFCGFSGKFRRFPNADGYLIFNLSSESKGLIIKEFDEHYNIVIVDGNGYEYNFIPDESTKEPYDNGVAAQTYNLNRSWTLRSIKALNGRKITFNYHEYKLEGDVNYEEQDITYTPSLTYDFAIFNGCESSSNSYSSDISMHESRLNHHKLSSIIFPDQTRLTFFYVDGEQETRYLTPGGEMSEARGFHKRLNSITATHNDNTFKKVKFDYGIKENAYGTGNKMTFLKSVNISGQGSFSFDYYDMAGYPALGSIQSDHWGYYNGAYGGFPVTNFWTHVNYDSCYNESYSYAVRKNPSFEVSLSGALKQINYPTGGYSRISYEPHDYSELVRRNSTSHFLPCLATLGYNEPAGGIRLKQIITYLSDSVPNDTTTYDYSLSDSDLSSGILLNVPRYGIVYDTEGKHVKHYNLTNHIYDYNQTHIEYSRVREHKTGKGFTDYHYSTYQYYPDEILEENMDARQPLENYWTMNDISFHSSFHNPSADVTNILTPIPSQQFKRGLLLNESNYDSMGVLKKSRSYNYSFPLVYVDTVYKVTGEIAREVYYPRYNNVLNSIVETDSLENGKVTQTTKFVYNSHGQPSRISTTTSEGDTIIEKTVYSGDSIAPYGIIKLMNDSNIVNNVLQKETSRLSNGTETLLNKTKFNYYQPNIDKPSLVRLSSVEKWNQQNGWKQDETYLFDNLGLLKQNTDADGVSTSYLWGYGGRYPLAIVQNATSAELEQNLLHAGISSVSLLRDTSYIDEVSFSRLMSLCNRIPQALVNIYKYKPDVGMTENVMPNSLKTFYGYDGYGRLITVSDNSNKTIEHNDYNLVTIKPLTLTVSCPSSCHINDSVRIVSNACGGMGDYQYSCIVRDIQNNILFQSVNGTGVFEFLPCSIIAFQSDSNYTVECSVVDVTSNETCNSCHTLHVNNAIIRFNNITYGNYNLNNGNVLVSATIYSDDSIQVDFNLNLLSSGTCVIKVNGTNIPFSGNRVKTGSASLMAGNNSVEMIITSSFSETSALLEISHAQNHEIGTPYSILLEF